MYHICCCTQLEVYLHSIAWFPKCARNQFKSVPHRPFCQSVSCKKTPGEGPVCCNTPQRAYFCHLGGYISAQGNVPIAPDNMRAGEWWINTSRSHDAFPWSREENSKEPFRESLAHISELSYLFQKSRCVSSPQACRSACSHWWETPCPTVPAWLVKGAQSVQDSAIPTPQGE